MGSKAEAAGLLLTAAGLADLVGDHLLPKGASGRHARRALWRRLWPPLPRISVSSGENQVLLIIALLIEIKEAVRRLCILVQKCGPIIPVIPVIPVIPGTPCWGVTSPMVSCSTTTRDRCPDLQAVLTGSLCRAARIHIESLHPRQYQAGGEGGGHAWSRVRRAWVCRHRNDGPLCRRLAATL